MGSHATAEDLIAGEINYANDITLVVACKNDQGDARDFSGQQILLVMPDTEPAQRPTAIVDGVTGYGYLGGAGVRGLGCPINGPRGDGRGAGTGGIGVIGHGGTGDLTMNAATVVGATNRTFDPGTGVLGIGGFWTGLTSDDSTGVQRKRDANGGAGVIGVAGGQSGPSVVPSFDQTKGVGVYGASAVGKGVVAEGAQDQTGLLATGRVGVEALGSVVGIEASGGAVGLKAKSTGDKAAFGSGLFYYGVDAEGIDAGIHALGKAGPAGIFEVGPSEGGPRVQLQIEPQKMHGARDKVAFSPVVMQPAQVGKLPRVGKAGQILVTINVGQENEPPPDQDATLWFCSQSGGNVGDQIQNAIWREVLLGPPIKGQA
jgi:hypothetical protein